MAKKKATGTWTILKSGVRKNGDWYASQYTKGWYFTYSTDDRSAYRTLGPFKTFEAGLEKWQKEK